MMKAVMSRPTDVLASFFTRLEAMDAVLRIIVSEARIRALLTFRGDPERRVLLDFSKSPLRVVLDDQSRDVDMSVTIRGEVMHEILSGRTSAGRALGERELLLRGSASYLEAGLSVVLFTPDDVQLPRGSPADRRRLVDRAIANLWPGYIDLARDYQKTLQSRNRVLREGAARSAKGLLEVYSQQLAELAARVMATRLRYLRNLSPSVTKIFAEITRSGARGHLQYEAPAPLLELGDTDLGALAAGLRRELQAQLAVDRARQTTTVGPHTHDVGFVLDGRSTRSYGSQGQLRSLVLSFKIAQVIDAQAKRDEVPVLLLDDVSSELDADCNTYMFDFLYKYKKDNNLNLY